MPADSSAIPKRPYNAGPTARRAYSASNIGWKDGATDVRMERRTACMHLVAPNWTATSTEQNWRRDAATGAARERRATREKEGGEEVLRKLGRPRSSFMQLLLPRRWRRYRKLRALTALRAARIRITAPRPRRTSGPIRRRQPRRAGFRRPPAVPPRRRPIRLGDSFASLNRDLRRWTWTRTSRSCHAP